MDGTERTAFALRPGIGRFRAGSDAHLEPQAFARAAAVTVIPRALEERLGEKSWQPLIIRVVRPSWRGYAQGCVRQRRRCTALAQTAKSLSQSRTLWSVFS